MPDPERPGGGRSLADAITRLDANIERLVLLLSTRQQDSARVAASVEHIDTKVSGLAGAMTALREKSSETSAETERLAGEHAKLTVWLTQVEQRVDDSDQPQDILRVTVERLADRITRLEQRGQEPPFLGVRPGPSGDSPPSAPWSSSSFPAEGRQPPPEPDAGASVGRPPADLTARVERVEWKQQTLSRIVQQLVERLIA